MGIVTYEMVIENDCLLSLYYSSLGFELCLLNYQLSPCLLRKSTENKGYR